MENINLISDEIKKNGFVILKEFLVKEDITADLVQFLSNANSFKDGVIKNIPLHSLGAIHNKLYDLVPKIAKQIGVHIFHDEFFYSAIRLHKSDEIPYLRRSLDIHRDPKIIPGGVINWHLDHFSFYLTEDHKNYLIFYLPVMKPDPSTCNLALIPYGTLQHLDPNSFNLLKHRGAVRFRCVEEDTKSWFELRFPNESIEIGQWFAIDDYFKTPGWKMTIDLDKNKVVPNLAETDLLIMRADIIHKTNDACADRISIRCDALPKNFKRLDNWFNLVIMCLKLPFEHSKVRYNKKLWLKQVVLDKFNLYQK